MIILITDEKKSINRCIYHLSRLVESRYKMKMEIIEDSEFHTIILTDDKAASHICPCDSCNMYWMKNSELNDIDINKDDIKIEPYISYTHKHLGIKPRQIGRVITHKPSGVHSSCQAKRDGAENEAIAIDTLKLKLAAGYIDPPEPYLTI